MWERKTYWTGPEMAGGNDTEDALGLWAQRDFSGAASLQYGAVMRLFTKLNSKVQSDL